MEKWATFPNSFGFAGILPNLEVLVAKMVLGVVGSVGGSVTAGMISQNTL